MLTPQEVSERAFQKASFGGYHMAQVDEFLDVLTADYTALFNENAVLKSKMKVLVDKVEEYRSTEDAMRKALLAAQKMADDMVKEAENRKAEIIRQAESAAANKMGNLSQEVEAEEYRLEKAREATAAFVAKVRGLCAEEEAVLSGLEDLCPPPAPAADPVDEAVSEIDDSVQRLLAQAMRDTGIESGQAPEGAQDAPEPEEEPDPDATAVFTPAGEDGEDDPPEEPTSRIDFGELQFGRDYEIR